MMYTVTELFDLTHSLAGAYLARFTYPWEALAGISDEIVRIGSSLSEDEFEKRGEDVWIAKDAVIYPSAYIKGPCIIGHRTEVRHCAFIRGSALIGNDCVVGNSVELKNVILFDHVQTPHFNYVGDSILGFYAHMGAGSIISNVKADKRHVVIRNGKEQMDSGRKKVGAMLGNYVEVGCNAVLNPGTVVGCSTNIYPTGCIRGVIPANSICKATGEVIPKR